MSRQPSLAAVVRQNAHASRYLGVDFVPVYRSARHAVELIADEHSAGTEETAPIADPRAVEIGPNSGSTSAPSHAGLTSPPGPPTTTPKMAPKPSTPAPNTTSPAQNPKEKSPSRTSSSGFVPRPPQPGWNNVQIANWELLEAIRKRYEEDAPHQYFVTDHHCIVFGDGDPCARLMFIGEAPGAEEDRVGKPFVGRAGELLNKMITAMGLSRPEVYITNVLKTRPPNNATPTLDEARLCAPYLFDQIGVIQPQVIVTLGLPATRLILGTDQTMGALRGKWAMFKHGPVTVPVMPTYHPAFLLRSYTKENREKVWSDLQKAMERLGMKQPTKVPD